MWRGRYQLGDEVALGLLTADASGTPTWPDDAPSVQVWCGATLAYSGQVPVLDRYGTTGLFEYKLFLGGSFSAGRCRVLFGYTLSGDAFTQQAEFDVVAGGDAAGAVQSLVWYHRPHGEFVVQQTSGGSVFKARNPRV